MRRDAADMPARDGDQGGESTEDLLTRMIQTLLSDADMPPREVEGVSEEFCDSKTSVEHPHGFCMTVY